jgi:hypothetical protein
MNSTINKLLRSAFAVGALLSGALLPAVGYGASINISDMVAVSTTPASPTKIIDGSIGRSTVKIMLHWSGSGTYPNGEFLLLRSDSSDFNTSATTGTARIPAGQRPSDFIEIDVNSNLYGVIVGTTGAQNVTVIRTR